MRKNKKVIFTQSAINDLREIYSYIKSNDSRHVAEKMYVEIKKVCTELNKFPLKGHVPPELERITIYYYLEINFKSFRIIYRVLDNKIAIFGILDGRRDMKEILMKRLLH